jgi:urate oxidase
MSDVILTHTRYGKTAVRVVKVVRDADQHRFKDLDVAVAVEGDFMAAHLEDDNRQMLATDTMRNAIYALAKTHPLESSEQFGLALIDHFLQAGPTVERVRVRISEALWRPIAVNGQPHPHSFVREAGERTATIEGDAQGNRRVEAGIGNVMVLKTTQSGWENFVRDAFTTLPDTNERILATIVTARWWYNNLDNLDYNDLWQAVYQQILTTFTDHYSPSVQATLYRIGQAVLAAYPAVEGIHLAFPNKHHLLFNLAPFGLENNHEIYHATTEPYGLIEGTVERRRSNEGAP